ncbi:3-oxoacyl-[acyl-carrier protein] reductase [Lentzea xinjiangensis]|uniref:3-oxoacyl-[acyl-carrier protein] reductase n=1 Tax=Lentzea xinjiangensis TaxID=402600 RepID=A0A1H9JUS8_9PSEU|nr:SDR family NAD(P)-dependent oxidoreductase [Lentzea xinjiangensis]SEQ90578.1 3-oxoacyl-[acyl-carrier protein] reductase [Lentzea xinjiangensis]
MELSGKVAIVTGAARGLGRAYAEALARNGAEVVVNDVDESVEEVAASIGGAAVVAPVGPAATADRLVATAVEEFGRLDVLVTNAGVLRDRVLWKMTDDDFDTVVDVHLRGTFTCARAAAVRMREQGTGGSLVLISSPAGQRGNFGQTNYSAAKAGIVAMARTWALELARSGITVNAVVPVAATEMTKTIPAFAPLIEESERTGAPLPDWVRRDEGLGTAEDVAGLIVHLASDAAKGITGQAIGIGGDRLALWAHPAEKQVLFAPGGWSAASIAERWHEFDQETYGIPLPVAP